MNYTGTEKQIKWATDIRNKLVADIEILEKYNKFTGGAVDKAMLECPCFSKYRNFSAVKSLLEITSAGELINRKSLAEYAGSLSEKIRNSYRDHTEEMQEAGFYL